MQITFPQSKRLIIASSGISASHTGNTNETILATIPIPAGIMGLNGILSVTTLWGTTSNANTKTPRVRLGGIGGTIFFGANFGSGSTSIRDVRLIHNRGAANSQVSFHVASNAHVTSGAITTGTVDTSIAQDLVMTGQLGTGTDTITLEAYLVEVLLP